MRAGDALPGASTGVLLAGESGSAKIAAGVYAVREGLLRGLPILGIGWGMHAINAAFGGGGAVETRGHGPAPGGGSVRHGVFLSPGAKISYTIGGSGWVTVNSAHALGISGAQLAPALLAAAYAEDRVVEAVELPGRRWVIGVQWRAQLLEELPKGFDSLLMAFAERAGFSSV